MKRRTFICIIYFLFCINIFGKETPGISVNFINLETNVDKDKKLVFECWKNYLESKPDSIYDNPFWNEADKRKYYSYDLLKSEGYISPGLYSFNLYNKVLEIRNTGDYYVIRSMFYYDMSDDDISILAITNHIAEKDCNGEYKLNNWLEYHTRNWCRKTLGSINYCYYPAFPFNIYDAEKANKMIEFLKCKLGAKIDKVDYYIAENCDEIFRLKGFDYVFSMGDNRCNDCGFTDTYNNIIYASAVKGANYQHELTRLINKSFPKGHIVFINGLAEYFNTTEKQLGLSHQEHFKRLDEYLKIHQEEDISDIQRSPFYTMDNQTPPSYYVGMIICNMVLEKGGFDLLKKAMNAGYHDDDLYKFFEKELGLKKGNINRLLRNEIYKYTKVRLDKNIEEVEKF